MAIIKTEGPAMVQILIGGGERLFRIMLSDYCCETTTDEHEASAIADRVNAALRPLVEKATEYDTTRDALAREIGCQSNYVSIMVGVTRLVEKAEMTEGLAEALREVKTWTSDCYCLSEEEASRPGGKTCPNCIADEALAAYDALGDGE